VLKELIGRERPNGNENQSMPSGHTSHSFTVAAIAHELYGNTVGTVAYLMAGLVAASRINDNKHYLSDVIVGAGLGTIIGRGFAKTYGEYKIEKSNGINFSISIPLD
jgi:membrane-associated phospholipid phosphatase